MSPGPSRRSASYPRCVVAGNTHTKIVTLDLNEPAALDMVKGGNVAALVADEAYNIGVTVARAAAGSLVGKAAEPFLVVDSIAVTKDTINDGWKRSLNEDVPATRHGRHAVAHAAGGAHPLPPLPEEE